MAELKIMGSGSYLERVLRETGFQGQVTGGDTKMIWDPDNADEVASVRDQFNKLRKKGFNAYAVTGKEGKKGTVIDEFDPDAGRIIMAPAMAGG